MQKKVKQCLNWLIEKVATMKTALIDKFDRLDKDGF